MLVPHHKSVEYHIVRIILMHAYPLRETEVSYLFHESIGRGGHLLLIWLHALVECGGVHRSSFLRICVLLAHIRGRCYSPPQC